MSFSVTAGQSIVLNESNAVAAVLQNISIILGTRRGTVPLDRELGLPTDMLDRPISVVRALLIADIREAIEAYEPRAKVTSISFEHNNEGTLIPTVEVEISAAE